MKERPLPDLLPKPSIEDSLTYALAIRLLAAVGVEVAGFALALTQITALIFVGFFTFLVGFGLYLFVEWRVADVIYPGHWGIIDLRVGTVLRFQLLTVGLVRAVRVIRDRRRLGRT